MFFPHFLLACDIDYITLAVNSDELSFASFA